jgi:ribulose-5-phosphate 4-epimerase/fuculose-1-phosphate aldolase
VNAPTEPQIRRDLAAAYRLAALRGRDDTVWTHISASVPGAPGRYLINRFGLRFGEITPANLVMVDVGGRVVDGSDAPVNPSGLAFAADEQRRLVAALGDLDGLILENHDILVVGRTVAEAFVLMMLVERAAQVQITAMAATGGMPLLAPDEVAERTYRQWIGDGRTPEGADEWPALLRSLDDPAFTNP